MEQEFSAKNKHLSTGSLSLHAHPVRKYIRKDGSEYAIDFRILVGPAPERKLSTRPPLNLALVLDRSGSMQGEKLTIAKQATLAVLDQLTEQDRTAVVVFDDRIDIVQSAAQVTPALKSQMKKTLQGIEARANTALHEGWLTGCNTIVSDIGASKENALIRCFLLTDGIANVGVTDPEHIAGEAAGVREHTNISTSTFGIGSDYNELLLGPMAVAGGGQFHHLRTPDEIFNTFVGELGDLLSVAVRQVRLEIELESGLTMDVVSAFWLDEKRNALAIGDLQYNEEQHAVIRVHFPAQWNTERRTVRARLVWLEGKDEQKTDWQELHFNYVSDAVYEEEVLDPEAVHWTSLQEADHARREAMALNKHGDYAGSRAVLQKAMQQFAAPAAASAPLQAELSSLQSLHEQMAPNAPLPPGMAKEQYYQQQRRSRNKKDHRSKDDQ